MRPIMIISCPKRHLSQSFSANERPCRRQVADRYDSTAAFYNHRCTFRKMLARAGISPVSYVFLKQKGKKDMHPKKVLIPGSLVAFKRSAGKALGESRPIASFMAENGRIITNIHDLAPNSTIFVVYESTQVEQTTTTLTLPSSDKKRTGIKLQVSQPMIRGDNSVTKIAITPQSNKGAGLPPQKSTPSIVLSVKKSPNVMPGTETKAQIPTTPISGKPPAGLPAAQLTPTVDHNSADYDEEESIVSEASEVHMDPIEEESEPEIIIDNKGDQILESIIPITEMHREVSNAFAQIDPDSQSFLGESFKLEESQQERYYTSIMKAVDEYEMFPEAEQLIGVTEMRQRAREIINAHRTVGASGVSYHFKTAIVGTPKSGKTTFLRILLQELLVDVVATDSWKKTFVFPVDMSRVIDEDPTLMFKKWVEYVFAQLRAQVPAMLEYLPSIEKCFAGLMETKGTAVLPRKLTAVLEHRKLASELQRILSNMAANWYDSTALVPWWTSVIMLPNMLANAFGFKTIVSICDHFDETSMEIHPSYPFEGSPHIAFLSEIWKYCVNQGSCIFGVRRTPEFMRLLDAIDDFSFDMSNYVDYYNMYNIIKEVKYQDKEIVVEFDESNELLKIYASICAGVPNYLTKWYELNEEFDELDVLDSKSVEYEEKLCFVMTKAESLISMVYLSQGEDGVWTNPLDNFSVADVRRRCASK